MATPWFSVLALASLTLVRSRDFATRSTDSSAWVHRPTSRRPMHMKAFSFIVLPLAPIALVRSRAFASWAAKPSATRPSIDR